MERNFDSRSINFNYFLEYLLLFVIICYIDNKFPFSFLINEEKDSKLKNFPLRKFAERKNIKMRMSKGANDVNLCQRLRVS